MKDYMSRAGNIRLLQSRVSILSVFHSQLSSHLDSNSHFKILVRNNIVSYSINFLMFMFGCEVKKRVLLMKIKKQYYGMKDCISKSYEKYSCANETLDNILTP